MRPLLTKIAVSTALAIASLCAAAQTFWIGVNTHYAQGRGVPEADFDIMKRAGINSFRDEIKWGAIEVKKDQLELSGGLNKILNAVDLAQASGIQPLIILDYGNGNYGGGLPVTDDARTAFARYAEYVASRLKGKVQFYEVWNEWNAGAGGRGDVGRDPESYVKLLKLVYPAVKRGDAAAVVLGGAVEGAGGAGAAWIEGMLSQGAADFMDGLSVHPYIYHRRSEGTPENLLAWLEGVIARIAQVVPGRQLPIYITETGWPTFAGDKAVPEEKRAYYLARTYLLARTLPSLQGVWWYELSSSGSDPNNLQHAFGLVGPDGTQRPSYFTLRDVSAVLLNSQGAQTVYREKTAWLVKISRGATGSAYAVWAPDDRSRKVHLVVRLPVPGTLSLHRLGDTDHPPTELNMKAGDADVPLDVDGTPIILAVRDTDFTVLRVQVPK